MNTKAILSGACVSALIAFGCAHAQRPPDNVSPRLHPNIAEAQRLVTQAYDRISAAQSANEFDMNGHAARAKDLLTQANAELKAAAETANGR